MRHHKPRKITSRVSSVTNGFVQAITPDIALDLSVRERVLQILNIDPDPDMLTCAYCGAKAHHWDHLNPYVRNKQPSGYLNEARNLVPACGPCNTSKSGAAWRTWMSGQAKGSPAMRSVQDLPERISRLDQLEAEMALSPIDLERFVEPELWSGYWQKLRQIEQMLFASQADAELIKEQITAGLTAQP